MSLKEVFSSVALSLAKFNRALLPECCKLVYALLVAAAIGMLAGCGGGGGGDTTRNIVQIGNGLGAAFQADALSISNTALNDGESATIEVSLVNSDQTAYTTPTDVVFTASCATSSITPATVATSNGAASVNYVAGTCEGTDTITATAVVDGNTLTASGSVTIRRPVNILLSIDNAVLTSGGNATVAATLAYNNLTVYTTPTEIVFTASCASSSFTPATTSTSGGVASVGYTAGDCMGTDVITATAIINGNTVTATVDVTVTLAVMFAPLSINNTNLSTGESTTVTATLTYSDNSPYDVATPVNFTTSCATSSFSATPVATVGGVASATYVAGSCSFDTVTAIAVIDGQTINMSGNISITTPSLNLLFGRGSGATFEIGMLEAGTGSAADGQPALAAGGSTTITATIVDADNSNSLYSATSPTITFSSPCFGSGNATMNSQVIAVGGVATTTYVSTGCVGDDTITASVTLDGVVHAASVVVTSTPASIGAIQFISAAPSQLGLAGMSGNLQETSLITFRVLDNYGDPIEGQTVNFSLNTIVGGISLSTNSAVTQVNGNATTVLQSGTVTTPVVVTAATTDVNSGITYSTQSDAVLISSGMADDDSFSLSISDCNPAGAYENDGVTVDVMVAAADHFNNPVPDGTAVSFLTEGGSIDSSCLTINGACSVTWVSQNPRPSNPGDEGRATILAAIAGNESFTDSNFNGIYDDDDPVFTADYTDLPEAWVDTNENGVYDAGMEEFLDFNADAVFNSNDGLYSGVLCQRTSGCAASSTLIVSRSGVIHMASNNNTITINGGAGDNADFNLPLSTDTPLSVTIFVNSTTGHYPATGTTITVETSNGTIIGTSNFVVPNNCGTTPGQGYEVTINVLGDGSGNTGIFTVTATSGGISSQQTVNVTDQTE